MFQQLYISPKPFDTLLAAHQAAHFSFPSPFSLFSHLPFTSAATRVTEHIRLHLHTQIQ